MIFHTYPSTISRSYPSWTPYRDPVKRGKRGTALRHLQLAGQAGHSKSWKLKEHRTWRVAHGAKRWTLKAEKPDSSQLLRWRAELNVSGFGVFKTVRPPFRFSSVKTYVEGKCTSHLPACTNTAPPLELHAYQWIIYWEVFCLKPRQEYSLPFWRNSPSYVAIIVLRNAMHEYDPLFSVGRPTLCFLNISG